MFDLQRGNSFFCNSVYIMILFPPFWSHTTDHVLHDIHDYSILEFKNNPIAALVIYLSEQDNMDESNVQDTGSIFQTVSDGFMNKLSLQNCIARKLNYVFQNIEVL